MRSNQFDDIIDDMLNNARATLSRKSEGYSTEDDRLHNFRTGAALNGTTMEQVCWGMATKHIISISDMVMSGEAYDADIWDEKLGDAINYLVLLKAITIETTVLSDKTLTDLRKKLVGSRDQSEAPAEVTATSKGGVFVGDQNAYSLGVETPITKHQRDIASIMRVADKNQYDNQD